MDRNQQSTGWTSYTTNWYGVVHCCDMLSHLLRLFNGERVTYREIMHAWTETNRVRDGRAIQRTCACNTCARLERKGSGERVPVCRQPDGVQPWQVGADRISRFYVVYARRGCARVCAACHRQGQPPYCICAMCCHKNSIL